MTCTLTVLGCSGGIGQGLRTTAFLLNEDTLIDCGTGVGDLTLDQLRKIDRVFLTHSHLDHITSLPFMLDAVGAERQRPLEVFGLAETLDVLKNHIFNNLVWPDFTRIPSSAKPWVTLNPLTVGQQVIRPEFKLTALPASHSIPGIGYAIESELSALVFTGDSGPCSAFWEAISQLNSLKHLIVETSFIDAEADLAKISGHYHPTQLVNNLNNLTSPDTQVWISHLKPGSESQIFSEILKLSTGKKPHQLAPGQKIHF